MHLIKMILVQALLVFCANQSFAIVHFEPFAGYQTQKFKLKDLTNVETSIESNAPIFGTRVGLRTPIGISIDLYGSFASGNAKFNPELTEAPAFSHIVGAVQLGVSAMKIMKIYLGYIFSNHFRIEANPYAVEQKFSGAGYQTGIGLYLTNSVSLTANYNINQFKTLTGETFTNGDDIKTYYSSHDLSDLSFVLSYTF